MILIFFNNAYYFQTMEAQQNVIEWAATAMLNRLKEAATEKLSKIYTNPDFNFDQDARDSIIESVFAFWISQLFQNMNTGLNAFEESCIASLENDILRSIQIERVHQELLLKAIQS